MPKNCAVGKFIINSPKDFRYYFVNSSVRCIQCKPGYRAIYDENNLFSIVNCEKIEYCDTESDLTSEWFNSCSRCEPYHAWPATDGGDIKYNQCIHTFDPNCMVAIPYIDEDLQNDLKGFFN